MALNGGDAESHAFSDGEPGAPARRGERAVWHTNRKAYWQRHEHQTYARTQSPQTQWRRWRKWRTFAIIPAVAAARPIPLNRNHVFDSSGPEVRIRGTAQQLFEKYSSSAATRPAAATG